MESNTADVENKVLTFVGQNGQIENTEKFCADSGIAKEILDPVLKSLDADEYVKLTVIEKKIIELTDEGKSYAQNGSPEFQFVSKITMGEEVDMAEMENRVGK